MYDLAEFYHRQLCHVARQLVDRTPDGVHVINKYRLFQLKDYIQKLEQIQKRQETLTIIKEKINDKSLTQRNT